MAEPEDNESSLRVEKVLLVDDFVPLLNGWARDCKAAGLLPLIASTREEAIAIAEHEQPQIAIIDLHLPQPHDGLAVVRAVKSLSPGTFVILVSADPFIDPKSLVRDSGADECLPKPVRCMEIIARVEHGRTIERAMPSAGIEVNDGAHDEEIDRLYECLVQLSSVRDPEPLLIEALDLAIELSAARLVYIELRPRDLARPRYTRARGSDHEDDVAAIRKQLSSGIVEHVMTTGDGLFVDPSADSRFAELSSVRENEIRQVIVVPVGKPASGVLYFQARPGGSFAPAMKTRAENFSRLLAPLVTRLLGESSTALQDHTHDAERRHIVDVLERHDGNVTAAAKELDVSRAYLHVLMNQLGIRR